MGKGYFITGGTGTLGNALLREIVKEQAPCVIIYSRSEYLQSVVRKRWSKQFENIGGKLLMYLGDVRDLNRLQEVEMKTYRDSNRGGFTVIHAAAMKQIGRCQESPFECYQTNVIGTSNVLKVFRHNPFVLVSSDKAVSPHNAYGCSKAMAEHLVLSDDSWQGRTVVRYGNVLGSRGSVLETWKNTPIDEHFVTDSYRYWIKPSHAAQFILRAIKLGTAGSRMVYYPDMPMVNMMTLHRDLYGQTCRVVNLAPGEKKYEKLKSEHEGDNYVLINWPLTNAGYDGVNQEEAVLRWIKETEEEELNGKDN